MAEGESTLKYEGYTRLTTPEKKEWWRAQPEGKFKIGLLRSKDLDKVITVFTETFDFGKRMGKNTSNAKVAVKVGGDGEEVSELEGKSAAVGAEGEEPEPFNTAENSTSTPEVLDMKPEKFFTAEEFTKRYLGWIPDGDPKTRIIQTTMKNLFRYIFGKQTISELNKFHRKLRIAYTPLEPLDKIPCKKGADGSTLLWKHFKQSLEYRHTAAVKEYNDTKMYMPIINQEVDLRYKLAYGLDTMIRFLEDDTRCSIYGNDPSMKEPVEQDSDYARILEVFRNFVRMKKDGKVQSLQELLAEFKRPGGGEGAEAYYRDILALLDFTANTEYAKELEDIVLALSSLIVVHDGIRKVSGTVKDIRHSLDILVERHERATELAARLREFNVEKRGLQERVGVALKAADAVRDELGERIGELQGEPRSGQPSEPRSGQPSEPPQQQGGQLAEPEIRIRSLASLDVSGQPISVEYIAELHEETRRKQGDVEDEIQQTAKPMNTMKTLSSAVNAKESTLESVLLAIASASSTSSAPAFPFAASSDLSARLADWVSAINEERDAITSILEADPSNGKELEEMLGKETLVAFVPTYSSDSTALQESPKNTFCDLFMRLLLTEASTRPAFNCKEFVRKGFAAIQQAGQRALVCDSLRTILDISIEHGTNEEFTYTSLEVSAEELEALHNAITTVFTEEERAILDSFAPSMSVHAKPPADFSEILGTGPYSLSGKSDSSTLHGLEEVIEVEDHEREAIERGGISMGAALFLYLVCVLA